MTSVGKESFVCRRWGSKKPDPGRNKSQLFRFMKTLDKPFATNPQVFSIVLRLFQRAKTRVMAL